MKRHLVALALALAGTGTAFAQVGVSIGINEPGVYGRINIGEPPPPPALVQPRPLLIAPPRVGIAPPPPLYLYVPLAEQRDWRRYCRRYEACGQPVYFVRDDWVRERYVHEHPDWRPGRRGGPPPREMRERGDRFDHGRDGPGPRGDHDGRSDDRGGPRDDHGRRGGDR